MIPAGVYFPKRRAKRNDIEPRSGDIRLATGASPWNSIVRNKPQRGGDLEEFDCPGMRAAVDEEIRQGKKKRIVLDYPFGREHPRFRELIDLSVWIDTPLDVALARRIVRDYPASSLLDPLREDLNEYLLRGRSLYLDSRHRVACDLILDGSKPLEVLRDQILAALPA